MVFLQRTMCGQKHVKISGPWLVALGQYFTGSIADNYLWVPWITEILCCKPTDARNPRNSDPFSDKKHWSFPIIFIKNVHRHKYGSIFSLYYFKMHDFLSFVLERKKKKKARQKERSRVLGKERPSISCRSQPPLELWETLSQCVLPGALGVGEVGSGRTGPAHHTTQSPQDLTSNPMGSVVNPICTFINKDKVSAPSSCVDKPVCLWLRLILSR